MSFIELLLLSAGIAYGYLKPGKQNKMQLLKSGALIGVGLGIIFGILALFVGALLFAFVTFWAVGASALVLTLIFIIGVIIGDFLEVHLRR